MLITDCTQTAVLTKKTITPDHPTNCTKWAFQLPELDRIRNAKREHFIAICLYHEQNVWYYDIHQLAVGGKKKVSIRTRDLLYLASLHPKHIIFIHNHSFHWSDLIHSTHLFQPAKSVMEKIKPSFADVKCAEELDNELNDLGINLLDFGIISAYNGHKQHFSFRQNDMLGV